MGTIPAGNPVYVSYKAKTNNMTHSQSLKSFIILYQNNQPADPQLWDGNFHTIFLFGVNKYLAGNAKNITVSILKMATFIKQYSLDSRTAKDISQIVEFGFAAW